MWRRFSESLLASWVGQTMARAAPISRPPAPAPVPWYACKFSKPGAASSNINKNEMVASASVTSAIRSSLLRRVLKSRSSNRGHSR